MWDTQSQLVETFRFNGGTTVLRIRHYNVDTGGILIVIVYAKRESQFSAIPYLDSGTLPSEVNLNQQAL